MFLLKPAQNNQERESHCAERSALLSIPAWSFQITFLCVALLFNQTRSASSDDFSLRASSGLIFIHSLETFVTAVRKESLLDMAGKKACEWGTWRTLELQDNGFICCISWEKRRTYKILEKTLYYSLVQKFNLIGREAVIFSHCWFNISTSDGIHTFNKTDFFYVREGVTSNR